MAKRGGRLGWWIAGCLLGLWAGAARAEDTAGVWRDDFEGPRVRWRQESTNALVSLKKHDMTDSQAQEGARSERFLFVAGQGSALYFSYPLPKVPIAKDLRAAVFVRSSHAGAQLLARVVLPADLNLDTGQPSFVTIAGPNYTAVDRWQKLELGEMLPALDEQLRVLRARDGRVVNIQGAYLERLILNLYCGSGETEIFVDNLTVSPVPSVLLAGAADPDAPVVDPIAAGTHAATPKFEMRRSRLAKEGYPWVFRAIAAPGADLERLRRAAFDVWSGPIETDAQTLEAARDAGFLLMPRLETTRDDRLVDPGELLERVARFPYRNDTVFWNLGRLGTARETDVRQRQREAIRELLPRFREPAGPASPLTTGSIAADLPLFAVAPHMDLFGFEAATWGACRDPVDWLNALALHRNLTGLDIPQGLYWTNVAVAPPEGILENIWGPYTPPAWGAPQVQPDQIRLFTYLGLMAGYRGLLFQGDAELTRKSGRARLIETTLLNAELDLIETIVAEGSEYVPIKVYPPDPKKVILYNPMAGGFATTNIAKSQSIVETPPHPTIAAVGIGFREPSGPRGMLLLLANLAPGAQWQAPGMAAQELKIRVPTAALSQTAAEISLAGLKLLKKERVPGGLDIVFPDFNTTAVVLLTGDKELLTRLGTAIERVRAPAVGMVLEQAGIQNRWVRETHALLLNDKHDIKGSAELLQKAEEQLASATDMLKRGEWGPCWTEARRGEQALRILMRKHFDEALNDLREASNPSSHPLLSRARLIEQAKNPQIVVPVSSPPLLSFNTLPEQHLWNYRIRQGILGPNLLPGGSFEPADNVEGPKWYETNVGRQEDAILCNLGVITEPTLATGSFLRMAVGTRTKEEQEREIPFLDQAPVAIRTPPVPVKAGQLIRIGVKLKSFWECVPGGEGIYVQDSIGGETLRFRTNGAIPDWQELILYRQPSRDDDLTVTIGMAAFGMLLVDDVKIQVINRPSADSPLEIAPPATVAGPANKPGPITRRLR